MDSNLVMLLIAVGSLIVGAVVGLGINYLTQKGKDPQAILSTANTVINEAKVLNDDVGKLILPAPIESVADKVIRFAQACVHASEQRFNSSQITKDQRNQNAFDATMNMLKIAGYEPTPEIQQGVKDMIETGVFALNSASPAVADAAPTVPNQTIQEAVKSVVTQAVTPIAQQAASDVVNQAINQAVTAVQGALTPQSGQVQTGQGIAVNPDPAAAPGSNPQTPQSV